MLRKILQLNNECLCPDLTGPGEIKQEGRRKLYRFVILLKLSKLGTYFMDFFLILLNQNMMLRTESVFIAGDNYDVWCKISLVMFVGLRQVGVWIISISFQLMSTDSENIWLGVENSMHSESHSAKQTVLCFPFLIPEFFYLRKTNLQQSYRLPTTHSTTPE